MFKKAFTIVEILVVSALVALMGSVLIPFFYTLQVRLPALSLKIEALHSIRKNLLAGISYVENNQVIPSALNISLRQVGVLSRSLSFSTSSYSFVVDVANWRDVIGKSTCNIAPSSLGAYKVFPKPYYFNSSFVVSDLDILNGNVYIAGKSTGPTSDPDFYILQIASSSIDFVSGGRLSANGKGFAAIHAIDGYVFGAEAYTRMPLVVINVKNRGSPFLEYSYTISTSTNLDGYGSGNAILYGNKKIFLGLTKATTSEIYVFSFDSKAPAPPALVGMYEVGAAVNAFALRGNTLFVGTPGQKQVLVLSILDSGEILEKSSIILPGYAVQSVTSLQIIGDVLYIGRTVGGFDNVNNHEFFAYDISDEVHPTLLFSKNVASSVNSLVVDHSLTFLDVGLSTPKLHIEDFQTASTSQILALLGAPSKIDCEDDGIAYLNASGTRLDAISHF